VTDGTDYPLVFVKASELASSEATDFDVRRAIEDLKNGDRQ